MLPDRLLNCTMPVSPKDTIKKVHTIVNKVAEEYGQNAAQAVSRAKAYMMEASETETEIQPEEVGRQVFATHPGMQQSYLEQVALASCPRLRRWNGITLCAPINHTRLKRIPVLKLQCHRTFF